MNIVIFYFKYNKKIHNFNIKKFSLFEFYQ